MRPVRIYGNWKMHKSPGEAAAFISEWTEISFKGVEIGVAPPFVSIPAVVEVAKSKGLKVGAQNCHFEKKGAFTGEISPVMLAEMGVNFVILGHSERRLLFGEDSNFVRKKVHSAIEEGLEVVLCVGETLEEREEGREKEVVEDMLKFSLGEISPQTFLEKVTIAYEPVWAIGTGKNATPEQAGEMHAFIREVLDKHCGEGCGKKAVIQYGGSVKPENAESLAQVEDIDGFLVGGASLDPVKFRAIIEAVARVRSLA